MVIARAAVSPMLETTISTSSATNPTTSLGSSTTFVASSVPTPSSQSASTDSAPPSSQSAPTNSPSSHSASTNSAPLSSQSASTNSAPPSSQSASTNSPSPTGVATTLNHSGLSSGVVAGIGVGTFFAGVLIALACTCLFAMLRKKKRRPYVTAGRQRTYRDSEHSQEDGTPMKQMASAVQPIGVGNDINLNRILLEPVSNNDIKTDMLALNSQILQHVDNNYHLKPVDKLPDTFTNILKQDGYSGFTGFSSEQVGNLLRSAQTRQAAIRHIISYFIFSKITLNSNIETSMLPSYVIAFLKQIPPPERTSGSREAFDQVLTKWRRLSAYLLQTVRSNRDPLLPQDSDIQPAITRNVTAIRQILAPFVVPNVERRQTENLQGLMAEGARLGLLLFQQPETWKVDWEVPHAEHMDAKQGSSFRAKTSAIVVFPGLIKTGDEDGKRYGKVKVVLDAEILQV